MKNNIGEKIKKIRLEKKMTLEELGNKVGVGKSTVRKWETGIIANMKRDKIQKLADALDVPVWELMEWDKPDSIQGNIITYKSSKIPVLSFVPCGTPITAIENLDIDDYVEIEEALARTGEYFALRAKGISMLPRIEEGDIMIVHQQPDIESGQVAIVRVNGEEATCKRIKKYHGGIELVSINPSYEPMFFDWEDVENKPVEILGRVIEVRSKL